MSNKNCTGIGIDVGEFIPWPTTNITSRMLCAHHAGKAPCLADSGGVLSYHRLRPISYNLSL